MAKIEKVQCDMCGQTDYYYAREKWGRLTFQPDCGLPSLPQKDLCPACVTTVDKLLKGRS